jgi:hypothetical protein
MVIASFPEYDTRRKHMKTKKRENQCLMPPRSWILVGSVSIDADGELVFPRLPMFRSECVITETKVGHTSKKVPGIYRLTFDKDGKKYVSIGKAGDFNARFYCYRKPTRGTEQEHVLRLILLDAGGATVDVIPECDLGTMRHQAEREEQDRAIDDKEMLLLNEIEGRQGRGYGHYLKFKVAYHEKALEEARRELKKWQCEPDRATVQDSVRVTATLLGGWRSSFPACSDESASPAASAYWFTFYLALSNHRRAPFCPQTARFAQHGYS